MPEWPEYIKKAFRAFYDSGADKQLQEAIETFASHWGGLDLETFSHVLEMGQGQDKLIALFALGYSGQPEIRVLLVPFLHSQVRMERWASALCLGEVKEEQALPVLQEMLQEGLFDQEESEDIEGVIWYERFRGLVASLLGRWDNPRLVPQLRQALQASWQREQQVRGPAPLYPWAHNLDYYHRFQDSLAFVLGKLGAFGVLLQLDIPPSRLRIALIFLVLGFLHASKGYRYHDILGQMMSEKTLREDVTEVLEWRFGIPAASGIESIEQFLDDYFARTKDE